MRSMLKRSTLREIKSSLGRYFAIFSIVALGVIMFAGLKVCRADMVLTADKYFNKTGLYDYRIISTLGFERDDYLRFEKSDEVVLAKSGINTDVIQTLSDGTEVVISTYSYTDEINTPVIVSGRLPQNDRECVVDSEYYDADDIGTKFVIADSNDDDTKEMFKYGEYTIVGTVKSPLYINADRGTSTKGNGKVAAFAYFMREAYNADYDSVIYLRMNSKGEIYSDEYDDYIEAHKEDIKNEAKSIAKDRYDNLCDQAIESMGIDPDITEYDAVTKGIVDEIIKNIEEPEVYVLGRDTNTGYVSFNNDSNIVNQVAAVFPVFFFAVAALVCMTTMTRMIEEQRTQIGVLKALGYSGKAILGKYLFYAGSAALGGALAGYVIGSIAFPKVIWTAYGMIYDFAKLTYVWDIKLAIISFVSAAICSIGATYLSCISQLRSEPAELIRPKAPKSGKTIMLEKITFIWKRLSFLHKVSIRNVFRYKKRFIMMVLGISGCTALVVAALGLLDSFGDIVNVQFDDIAIYDAAISVREGKLSKQPDGFEDELRNYLSEYAYLHIENVDISSDDERKKTNVVVAEDVAAFEKEYRFIDVKSGKTIAYPAKGEAVITKKIADKMKLKKGDSITITNSDGTNIDVKISGICKNYIYTYIFVNKDTFVDDSTEELSYNTIYAQFDKDTESTDIIARLLAIYNISSVEINEDTKGMFNDMMSSLDYVIMMIIFMAAALAFVVLYNLTNINITERIREIATIKVLGFYPKETAAYVFRENFVLTAFGALFGLVLGRALLQFVISCIDVDMIAFDCRISGLSYVLSVVITFIFAIFVNLFMYAKINRIDMVESLKSID